VQPSRRTLLRAGVATVGLRLLGPPLLAASLAGCDRGAVPSRPAAQQRRDAETARLQQALAAEHVAVYGYGVVGAWLAGAPRRDALAALDAHRVRRDQLIALLRSRGAAPTPAAPAYRLPFAVTDAASAARLASRLEAGVARAARLLDGSSDPKVRQLAARMLADATARQAPWPQLSG